MFITMSSRAPARDISLLFLPYQDFCLLSCKRRFCRTAPQQARERARMPTLIRRGVRSHNKDDRGLSTLTEDAGHALRAHFI